MTSPSTARRWLGILARHYPSLLVSGVCHNAIAEIEELEQHAEILRRDCHEYRAERDRLLSCDGCVNAPTEDGAAYDLDCLECRRFYGDLFVKGDIK